MIDQLNQPITELVEDQRHLGVSAHKKYLLIAISIFITASLLAGWWFLHKLKPSNRYENNQNSFVNPLLTEVPFADMTIPYLRQRSYDGLLGELRKISETSTYTSYLTNYISDNLKINGLLTRPKGEMPEGGWPAVVFVHGYIPPTQYKTQEKYEDYVNYLARNGLVVFKIDLRGHGTSEGEASGAYYSGDYIVDVLNARSALQKADFVNAEKIGLWGHSMAGNVVLRSVAANHSVKAAVIWAGAVYTYQDFRDFGIQDDSYRPPTTQAERQKRRQQLFDTYGQFEVSSEFWAKVAPTNYLEGYKGAIQLHHSTNDDVVSVKYSQNLKPILDNLGIKNEYYEYKTGGHNISNPAFSQAMQRTVEFFKRELN